MTEETETPLDPWQERQKFIDAALKEAAAEYQRQNTEDS